MCPSRPTYAFGYQYTKSHVFGDRISCKGLAPFGQLKSEASETRLTVLVGSGNSANLQYMGPGSDKKAPLRSRMSSPDIEISTSHSKTEQTMFVSRTKRWLLWGCCYVVPMLGPLARPDCQGLMLCLRYVSVVYPR